MLSLPWAPGRSRLWAGSLGGSLGVGSSLEVSTQPMLVGDRGVIILAAVAPPSRLRPEHRGGVSCLSVRLGPLGAGEPKGQKFAPSPSTWAPRGWAGGPGTPRRPGPLSHGSPSVVQDGAQASHPSSQMEGGVRPSWGHSVAPSFPPLW